MQRPIDPRRLLVLANELAGAGAGPGQPRNVNLRRASSTAYYAVFHAVALAVSEILLPGAPADDRWGVARYVSHTSIKRVCGWVSGDRPPQHLRSVVLRLRLDVAVTNASNAYTDLPLGREAADYDHTAEFSRPGTLASVRSAERAVDSLRGRPFSDEMVALLGLIALQTNIR